MYHHSRINAKIREDLRAEIQELKLKVTAYQQVIENHENVEKSQQNQIVRQEQAIDKYKLHEAEQQQVERHLNATIKDLRKRNDQLLHENYELQADTIKVVAEFPTPAAVIDKYTYFGQSIMVDFISNFEFSCDSFTDQLAGISADVLRTIAKQYDEIVTILFPGSLHHIAHSNAPISRELSTHLQRHYKDIMNLDTWCTKHKTTIADHFVPLPFQKVPNLEAETTRIVYAMHNHFCLILLTQSFEFGELTEFNPALHTSPYSKSPLTVVLPHLVERSTGNIVQGFGY